MKPSFFISAKYRLSALNVLVVLLISCGGVHAQSPTGGTTPLGLSPGAPEGSYSLSGFESINPYNGNLNFHLPLVSISGRGGASSAVMLEIDAKSWTVKHTEVTDPNTGLLVDVYTPTANWWTPKPGYSPGKLVGRISGVNPTQTCNTTRNIYVQTLTRLTFTAADGTEYELRDTTNGNTATGGQPATVSNPCSAGASRGTVFITADGTAATFISDSTISDDPVSGHVSLIYPSGDLLLRDGTRYRIDGGNVTWIRDRNGNKLTFSYTNGQVTSITDSISRQITITYADFVSTFSDQITYKGFGGASRTISVNYASLSNALRSDFTSTKTPHQLFPELNNASSSSQFNPTVVSSVTLPNSQQYQLKYNADGELARVVLPTGGVIEHDYTSTSGAVTDGTDYHIYRRVKERRVFPDGSTLEGKTTYSEPSGTTNTSVTVDHLNPSSTLLAREIHYFYGNASNSLFAADGISYPGWQDGREYQTESTDTSGVAQRRVSNTWQQGVTVSSWNTSIPNNTRLSDTTTTLLDVSPNLVSKQTFGYDDSVAFNNQNNVKEYDFGSGSAGALVRETRTTFVTSSTYTDTTVHLRSLPSQVSIYEGGTTERARTTFEYDNYATDANHAGLTSRSAISGLDSSYTTSYTTRGNVTGTTRYLLPGSGTVSAYSQYDVAGNVVKTIDPRGNSTNIYYTDCFGAPNGNATSNTTPSELSGVSQSSFAFVTSVTNAMSQTAYSQYDYYLGRPVDGQDANGAVASGYYDDSLDRPTKLILDYNNLSAKTQKLFSYDDANKKISTVSDQASFNDQLLKTEVLYDGLGRTTDTRSYESSSAYITVQQSYDALGRKYRVSNPFRSGDTTVWTTTAYDALGRVTSVTTPDSSVVGTAYSGNAVTVNDQVGKLRRSITDALGRLTRVDEPDNSSSIGSLGTLSSPNQATSYSYDALDDLTGVTQGSQSRSFAYDALKRLTSATNPESGTVSYGYDTNGNLTSRTDARIPTITTTIAYDALNRPTQKSYNDNPQTPTINYYYDSQTLPSGAPTFSRGYSTGRLVATTYGGGSEGTYLGYDALGRALLQIQRTGTSNYEVDAVYNLASAITAETYPSGRTVSYSYDQAGRTSSFTGYLGDSVNRTYSTGIIYSALGGMSKEQFGTDTPVYNKLFYNSRGQLSEIRESSSYTGPTDTDWNRGAIINHYSDQCWGACNGTDNNGNVKKRSTGFRMTRRCRTTWFTRAGLPTIL